METSPASPSANPTAGSTTPPSVDPLDPLTPGSHYERQFRAQEGGAALDVFAVLGLPANNAGLTQYGARKHYLRRVTRHVLERDNAASPTVGPLVPLWSHVNVAKQTLLDDATPEQFEALRESWSQHSVETWNPFALPGSPEALKMRPPGPCTSMSCSLLPTAALV